jgi:hypothetical protein
MCIENTRKSKEHQVITRAIIKTAIIELKHASRWETPEQWEKRTDKALLKALKWETPEQYQSRTGDPWHEDWWVFYQERKRYYDNEKYGFFSWRLGPWGGVKRMLASNKYDIFDYGHVVCATKYGFPPDDWEPGTPEA